jgi:hypothetical protein
MSEEVKFKYFLNGAPIQRSKINFEQNLEIRVVGNKVKITTLVKKEKYE